MKFDVNKLRSWRLRYIVRDYSGQLWAYCMRPVREARYWRLPDSFLPPKRPDGLYYYVDNDTHTVKCSNPELQRQYDRTYNAYWGKHRRSDQKFAVPLDDCPFDISWEDEPFDLVNNEIIDVERWNYPWLGNKNPASSDISTPASGASTPTGATDK